MERWIRWTPAAPAAIAIAIAVLFATSGRGGPQEDDSDPEERLEIGQAAFRDNCQMCHSEEMSARLRLSEKQWTAEVDKMAGMGSPVSPEQKRPLVEFLVSRYSDPKASPVPPPARMTPRQVLDFEVPDGHAPKGGDPARGAALYVTHCANCHGPEARGGDLGTCLVEKPVLWRVDFLEVVRKGRRRMPGFTAALKPEQEVDILAWLRTRRFDPPSQ